MARIGTRARLYGWICVCLWASGCLPAFETEQVDPVAACEGSGSSHSCADGEVVLAPLTVVRGNGPPSEEQRAFIVDAPGELCVLVVNGGPGGADRASAAQVEIDGTGVVGPERFNPRVEFVSERISITAGQHVVSVRVASRPGSQVTVALRLAAAASLEQRQAAAIDLLSTAALSAGQDALEAMSEEERASLLNTLAWFDDDPLSAALTRGPRGAVTHLSSRFLAFDATPELPASASEQRASAFAQDCHLGRALLALRDTDELRLIRTVERGAGRRRFVFEQRFDGVRVHDVQITLDLDDAGRMVRLDSNAVPGVAPAPGATLARAAGEENALEHVRALDDESLWPGVDPAVESSEEVVVNRLVWTGDDDERRAWQVFVVPTDPAVVGGRREVLVDRTDGSIIGDREYTRFLDSRDRILRGDGLISNDPMDPRPRLGSDPADILWVGGDPCPDVLDPPLVGGTPLDRDLDEAKAAVCLAADFFATRGAERGYPDFRSWIDPTGAGLRLGIGLTPKLSIGLNSNGTLFFAEGAARAESVGHEVIHTVLSASTPLTQFTEGGGDVLDSEGAAIEEHVGDTFGALVEQRFRFRNEDRCLLSDDPDTRDTISRALWDRRPCSLAGEPREWRSMCAPQQDNGGWCEGSARYGDLAYNRYELYGELEGGHGGHPASHTNLGVGNRGVAPLLGLPGARNLDGWLVPSLVREDFERTFLATVTEMTTETDWTRYGLAWQRGALTLFGSIAVSPQEQAVRTAWVGQGLWSMPHPARVFTAGFPPGPLFSTLQGVTPQARPAVTDITLPDGKTRTFVFYRAEGTTAIRYVYQDETPGGEFALAPRLFVGPCDLIVTTPAVPGEPPVPDLPAATEGSPAATSTDSAVFVAWAESTATPGVGILRGAALPIDAVATTGACTDVWERSEPGAERLVRGSPAIISWEPEAELDRVTCAVLDQLGVTPPFRSGAAMGFAIGDCVDIAEIIRDLPPDLGPAFWDIVGTLLETDAARGMPAQHDPERPGTFEAGTTIGHSLDLQPLLTADPQAAGALEGLAEPIGKRFRNARLGFGLPDGFHLRAQLDMNITDPVGPQGLVEQIHLTFSERRLVVAFRDEAGALRITRWSDTRPTDDPSDPTRSIATLEANPNPTDPALAIVEIPSGTVRGSVHARYLYVVYGTSEVVGGVPIPTRLSYRVATRFAMGDPEISESLFAPARRLDTLMETRGVRRTVDYRLARTLRTPAIVGSRGALHLFTVSLQLPTGVPDEMGRLDVERRARESRIRSAVVEVDASGELRPGTERPILLLDTHLVDVDDGRVGEVGAAHVFGARNQLRFYYPQAAQLSIRSRPLP